MAGDRYETVEARDYPPVIRHKDIACNPQSANLFYPRPHKKAVGQGGKLNYRPAKELCKSMCPRLNECLFWALESRQAFGVWGGADPAERRAMLRQGWRPHVEDVA